MKTLKPKTTVYGVRLTVAQWNAIDMIAENLNMSRVELIRYSLRSSGFLPSVDGGAKGEGKEKGK
jgi:hypothetical protein